MFTLPDLPYAHDALQPYMSKETLEYHHDKHHQAYVTALNGFVEKDANLQGKSLEEIVLYAKDKPELAPVFNNAGQDWNHIIFWQNLSPNGGGIPGALEAKIVEVSLNEGFQSGVNWSAFNGSHNRWQVGSMAPSSVTMTLVCSASRTKRRSAKVRAAVANGAKIAIQAAEDELFSGRVGDSANRLAAAK